MTLSEPLSADDRRDDAGQGAEHRSAVDLRRLVELNRHIVDGVHQHDEGDG